MKSRGNSVPVQNRQISGLCCSVVTHGECPLWVKSRHCKGSTECPLYPQKRTWELSRVMCRDRSLIKWVRPSFLRVKIDRGPMPAFGHMPYSVSSSAQREVVCFPTVPTSSRSVRIVTLAISSRLVGANMPRGLFVNNQECRS